MGKSMMNCSCLTELQATWEIDFFNAGPYKGTEFPKMACDYGHNFINTALINNT